MGILSWIIFGLIAGILAKWIMPGKDGGGNGGDSEQGKQSFFHPGFLNKQVPKE